MNIIRSWLIAPANRPNYMAKFPGLGADCSVIDLEDGVPEAHKAESRRSLGELTRSLRKAGLSGALTVRVNAPGSEQLKADLEMLHGWEVDGISVPKLRSAEDVRWIGAQLDRASERSGRGYTIVAGIESALGVLNASEIAFADERVIAMYFGAEDFATDLLGARRTREGLEVLYARSRVVLAAKARRIGAIDQGVLEIHDDARFLEDAEAARNLGYDGKVCLNPRQVELAHQAFSPSADEVDFSRRLIAAVDEAEARGIGTIDFEGRMIDGPLLKRCRNILVLADASGA